MADLKFYTNPMSRGQTVRWMLEEVGEPYETEILDYATTMKAEPYLSINPMGKVPAILHNGKVVTEVAAICCYLADAFPAGRPGAAARRPRRLLPLDVLHLGPGRGGVQQQGARAGNRPPSASGCSAMAITTSPSTRSRKRSRARTISPPTISPPPTCSSGANVNFMLAVQPARAARGVHRLCRAR